MSTTTRLTAAALGAAALLAGGIAVSQASATTTGQPAVTADSGLAAGTYADPAIQKLYDAWLSQGSTTIAAAYQVGVALGKRDIADLEKSIAASLPSDVDRVFGQLLKGSQNHLAAYQRAVAGDLGTGSGMMGNRAGVGNGGNGSGNGMRDGTGNGMRNGTGNGMRNGGGMGGDCPYADGDAS